MVIPYKNLLNNRVRRCLCEAYKPTSLLGGLALLLGLVFIPILHWSLFGRLALARGPDILTSITTPFCYGLIRCMI